MVHVSNLKEMMHTPGTSKPFQLKAFTSKGPLRHLFLKGTSEEHFQELRIPFPS